MATLQEIARGVGLAYKMFVMAYSKSLADRIRKALSDQRAIVERKMFGGVGFLLHGNLLVGVWQTALIARVGPDAYQAALAEPHVRQFDITGRAMTGWVLVEADGIDSDQQLESWLAKAGQFVATLPAK